MTTMRDHFFIMLPSNASMNLYPDNKTSKFKINLPNTLNLDMAKWEVGLSEFQFQHSWYNVREGRNKVVKQFLKLNTKEMNRLFQISHLPAADKKGEKEKTRKRTAPSAEKLIDVSMQYSRDIVIPPGHYSSVNEIIKQLILNDSTKAWRKIDYTYDTLSGRSAVILPKRCRLNLNGSDVERCLGFNENTVLENKGNKKLTLSSFSLASTENMYKAIYVYTDIIENQFVGDVRVPLLRVVPVTSQYGDICCIKYDKPYFIPLSRSNIQTIEVNLMDDTGNLISFEAGKSIITLQFRRKVARFFD